MPLLLHEPESTLVPRPATPATDESLVAAAQGQPQAFAPLFARYWEPVLRYCALRLASRAEAEDAASQTFVDTFAALPRFRPQGGSFRSWLFTIAHHEVANRRRDLRRHPTGPLQEAHDISDPLASPERAAVTASDISRMLALLEHLPPRPRAVVELRLAGLTDREIAGVLGISGEAVRQAQSRAVVHLRGLMGGSDPEKQANNDH